MGQASSIDYFRKQAKLLCNSAAKGDAKFLGRLRRYLPDSDTRFGLMKCQHVVALEHGLSSWKQLLHADEVELRLAITMAREPLLNDHGIGVFDGYRNLPIDQRRRILQDGRRELRKSVERVGTTLTWLRANLGPVKTLSQPLSSYFLKHLAEGDVGYITNGVFIAAAIIGGYPHRFYPDSPNVGFGVSRRSVRLVEQRQTRAGTHVVA